MCQLTYSNMHNAWMNSLMIYLLGKNGSDRHDDGVGFICSNNSIWKSEKSARDITNLGAIINTNIIDDEPIPFHIRSATFGIEVTRENAHPFIGEYYILMHNGTLLPRDGKESKDKKKDSDSKKFLDKLDSVRKAGKKKDFTEIFNEAMEEFAGKFALIIREIETKKNFIVRGKTAELWITYVTLDDKKLGYVINTSKETMKESIHEFINLWDISDERTVKFSEPVLLELESVFEAREFDILKIGKTQEHAIVKETGTAIAPYRARADNHPMFPYDDNLEAVETATVAYKIYDFLKDNSLSLLDYQLMIMVSGGISILEVTREDVQMFIDYIIPKISASDKTRQEVKRLLNGKSFPHELYGKHNLEYPWTLNDGSKVVEILKQYGTALQK